MTIPFAPQLPTAAIPVSKTLHPDQLYNQIADVQRQIAGLPAGSKGPFTDLMRVSLQKKLQSLQNQYNSIMNPTSAGITPPAEPGGSFSTQIETPKVGLNDLTIPLP